MLAAGFDGYLAKPIDPETFVRQMEVFLQPGHHTAPPVPAAATVAAAPGGGLPAGLTHPRGGQSAGQLDLARSILEPSGYTVITAEGMTEGLALAREVACDLILSDVCMSEGTGYDFIRAVKADPQLRAIPFVFITSTMLDEKDRVKGLALGAARFLFRPIEPEVFLAEIEACLRETGEELTVATILIVDDRPTNREYLVTLLGYGGHRLLEAGDGAEAPRDREDRCISTWSSPTSSCRPWTATSSSANCAPTPPSRPLP